MKEILVKLGNGIALKSDWYRAPEAVDLGKVAVICHGFSAHRRFAFLPEIAKFLAERGISSLIPDFSRNGMDATTGQLTDPEGFSRNTFEHERQELVSLIDVISKDHVFGEVKSIIVIGHSRGGVSALGAASDSQVSHVIERVSVWSAPSGTEPSRFGLTEEHRRIWEELGHIPYPIQRLGIETALGLEILEDMEREPNRVERYVRSLSMPLQIIHGTKDVRVPLSCGQQLAEWGEQSEFEPIEGADHVFQCSREFPSSAYLEEAIKALFRFL